MPIRAVIFDYGMVISNPADPAAHERMIAVSGLSRKELDRPYWHYRASYDLGMKGMEFWGKVADDAGTAFSPAQIDALIEADIEMWTSVNEEMLAWAMALRHAGIRTGILSNMVWEILGYMRREFAWVAGFDYNTWSCELGIAKPDLAIYLHACKGLDVSPSETLFLDDKTENITGAKEVGLQAIQFTTINQLRSDLEARGFLHSLPIPGAIVEIEE